MTKITAETLQAIQNNNKMMRRKTVHCRFLDECGRSVVLETGEKLPLRTHPAQHNFYFGIFTAEQCHSLAKKLGLRPMIYSGT